MLLQMGDCFEVISVRASIRIIDTIFKAENLNGKAGEIE